MLEQNLKNFKELSDLRKGHKDLEDSILSNNAKYEEVLNIHKNKLNDEFLSLIDTFPKQTSKINEHGYAYYGKDGVLISIDVCDYLFTKTKDGFVETIHFC